jgi:AraC family transcriptional regulator of adaptative response / DNA-3-methyladenine glycosylase II
VDGFEIAVRAVVGQQISVRGARTVLARIVDEHDATAFEQFRLFPDAKALAAADPAGLPMPRTRARTLHALAAAVDGGLALDPGADRTETRAALLAIPGIGPWTADYVAMRALADPDVLMAGDLGVRAAAQNIGLDLDAGRPDWSPWRSYATHHLWNAAH